MRSEKAWYWLTAGVLALGLNGAYQDGQLGWVHSLVDRTAGAVTRASERGMHFVTVAEIMLGRMPGASDRTEVAVRRDQNKIVCERVAKAQRQIAMAQVRNQLAEAKLAAKMNFVQMKMDQVRMRTIDHGVQFQDCPGFSKVVVDLQSMPKIDLSDLPDIAIPDFPDVDLQVQHRGNGPI